LNLSDAIQSGFHHCSLEFEYRYFSNYSCTCSLDCCCCSCCSMCGVLQLRGEWLLMCVSFIIECWSPTLGVYDIFYQLHSVYFTQVEIS